jgi:hypothetical protein
MPIRRLCPLLLSALAPAACSAPRAPQQAEVPSLRVDAGLPAHLPVASAEPEPANVVDASASSAPAPLACPTKLSVTHRIPALKQRTFMLAPEETTELDVDGLGAAIQSTGPWFVGKRIKGAEEALDKAFDRLLGDGDATITVKYEGRADAGPGEDRFSFSLRGKTAGYATCHGRYDTIDWSGTLAIGPDGTLRDMRLDGTSSIREDICNAKDGGRTRLTTGTYRATVRGKLEPVCAEISDPSGPGR